MATIAYAWASGLIEFGAELPEGTLPIACASDEPQAVKLRDVVGVLARHGKGKGKGQLLIPGIPEAPNQQAAMKAMQRFVRLVQADLSDQPRTWAE